MNNSCDYLQLSQWQTNLKMYSFTKNLFAESVFVKDLEDFTLAEIWSKHYQLSYSFASMSNLDPSKHFNFGSSLIWRHDVAQRDFNVETTLCTSTLKFTTLNKVETTLRFSTLNWTTLDNVKITLSFSTWIFTTLGNVETT